MTGMRPHLVLAAVCAVLAALLVAPSAMAAQSSEFVALTPYRVIDSRDGTGGMALKLGAGETLPVAIAGSYGVPANAGAASFNVTVTQPEGPGFLTVYPCGTPRPLASNLNYTAGQTVPNAVLSRLGRSASNLPRSICVYSSARTHLIIDLNGYFPSGADYQGMVPFRAADTRSGLGVPSGKVLAGTTLAVPVTDRQAVLADAAAVTVNVTVTQPSSAGYVTVWPCGEGRPFASNLNFVTGQTVPNAAIAGVGASGSICLYTTATTHLVVDIAGFFTDAADYAPLVPQRVFDTRTEPDGKLPATSHYEVQIAEPGELVAAVLNVTVTQPDGPGFITAYACDQDLPLASNLNFVAGQTVPNMVVVPVDADGRVCLYTSATTHLLADINGVFPVGTPTTRETVPVYYLVDAAGDFRIAREFHTAEITSSRAAAAVELMLSVPAADPDYFSPWNPATKVRSVVVAEDLITVDLSADARIASVGSDAAGAAVQQLIYTVTAAEQRTVPVSLLIEGQPAGELWGHVVWDAPISRAPILETRLLVQINDPAEGTAVPATFTVTGEAATFEAVVPWRITDSTGMVVQSGSAMTTEGFTMSPFEFTIAFTGQPGTYTLQVREDDPSGGEGGPVMTDDKTITIG